MAELVHWRPSAFLQDILHLDLPLMDKLLLFANVSYAASNFQRPNLNIWPNQYQVKLTPENKHVSVEFVKLLRRTKNGK